MSIDMKDMFLKAHDQLIEEYLEKYPNATEMQAIRATQDFAYQRATEMFANMVDEAKDRRKYG